MSVRLPETRPPRRIVLGPVARQRVQMNVLEVVEAVTLAARAKHDALEAKKGRR